MKRLTALALLLGLAVPASARTVDVMVITPSYSTSTAPTPAEYLSCVEVSNRLVAAVRRVLDISGASYDMIPNGRCKTEWARTGVFGLGVAASGVYPAAESARCVIVLEGFPVAGQTCRVDSISRAARGGPQVPMLLVSDNVSALMTSFGNGNFFDNGGNAADSCGVTGNNTAPSATAWPFLGSDRTMRWRMFSYEAPYTVNTGHPPVGGFRLIVGAATPNFVNTSTSQGDVNDQFPTGSHTLDDAGVTAGEDTAYVWDRPWTNIASCPGAKTQTFAHVAGMGFNGNDSTVNISGASGIGGEFGFDVLMAAMCHFDSLTLSQCGRRLIFGALPHPRRVALTVSGGLSRSIRYWSQSNSIAPQDTTSFYTTLDSLQAYGIPVTFGVNVDSASSYQRDIIKLKAVSLARFTPQVWTGILDTSSTRARNIRFNDIFGRFNNRAFAGDGSGVGADSSIASKLAQAKLVCDSIFGKPSAICVAPEDDYSPKQMRSRQNAAPAGSYSYADSLLYAVRYAGFTVLQTDGKYSDADPGRKGGNTNPRGWFRHSRRIKNLIDGKEVTVLAHAGYQLAGGTHWAWSFNDSTAPLDSSAFGRIEEERVGCGMWDLGGLWDSDVHYNPGNANTQGTYPWRDVLYRFEDVQDQQWPYPARGKFSNCRIMRLSCADLSGRQPDPARTGWLQIKFLDSWFRSCNQLAGTTIMGWGNPEDVEP